MPRSREPVEPGLGPEGEDLDPADPPHVGHEAAERRLVGRDEAVDLPSLPIDDGRDEPESVRLREAGDGGRARPSAGAGDREGGRPVPVDLPRLEPHAHGLDEHREHGRPWRRDLEDLARAVAPLHDLDVREGRGEVAERARVLGGHASVEEAHGDSEAYPSAYPRMNLGPSWDGFARARPSPAPTSSSRASLGGAMMPIGLYTMEPTLRRNDAGARDLRAYVRREYGAGLPWLLSQVPRREAVLRRLLRRGRGRPRPAPLGPPAAVRARGRSIDGVPPSRPRGPRRDGRRGPHAVCRLRARLRRAAGAGLGDCLSRLRGLEGRAWPPGAAPPGTPRAVTFNSRGS